MKIAVTGHTSGIGKGLYNFYKKNNHDVLGFSRSNGYDIEKKAEEIVEQVKDFDIFFNNAYCGFSQITLLFMFWEEWHNKDKLIINTNSAMCKVSYPYTYHPLFSIYKVHKSSLDNAVKELQQTPSKCQVSQITPGFTKTEGSLEEFIKDKKTLSVQEVIKTVQIIVMNWWKIKISDVFIGEVY